MSANPQTNLVSACTGHSGKGRGTEGEGAGGGGINCATIWQ